MSDEESILTAIQEISLKLTVIETKQEERHVVNQKDLKIIHTRIGKISSLVDDCKTVKTHLGIQWWFIGAIFLGIVVTFIRSGING